MAVRLRHPTLQLPYFDDGPDQRPRYFGRIYAATLCPACGQVPGAPHRPGCAKESCPVCGGHALQCRPGVHRGT